METTQILLQQVLIMFLLAMFAVGVYLAQCDFGEMLKKGKLYAVSAVRLLLIPLAALTLIFL